MSVLRATLLLIALQRLAELAWASRNAARLHRLGAIEIDATGYPPFIVLHLGWLASLALCVPSAAMPRWPLLGLFALLQLGRLWVIVSLGHYWTTRILTLPGRPLVQTGPYRWLRHPNYALVAAEIAVLPIAFGATALAAIWSVPNLMLIARRIRIEERALAPRRLL